MPTDLMRARRLQSATSSTGIAALRIAGQNTSRAMRPDHAVRGPKHRELKCGGKAAESTERHRFGVRGPLAETVEPTFRKGAALLTKLLIDARLP